MNSYHDDTHFIAKFIHKLPPGCLQTYIHRCVMGNSCFLRHFIVTVNEIFYLSNYLFQIGKASCRERVQISVGAVSLKKKTPPPPPHPPPATTPTFLLTGPFHSNHYVPLRNQLSYSFIAFSSAQTSIRLYTLILISSAASVTGYYRTSMSHHTTT